MVIDNNDSYENYDDKELDSLDEKDNYKLQYQVVIIGYDNHDIETGYYSNLDLFNTYEEAEIQAKSVLKTSLMDLTENEFYVRINIESIVVDNNNNFISSHNLEYSKILIIK